MKLTRYEIIDTDDESMVERVLTTCNSEAEANVKVENLKKAGWNVRIEPIEVDFFCESCEREIRTNEKYIELDYQNIFYCCDCYTSTLFTYYEDISGELIGDENDITEHDE